MKNLFCFILTLLITVNLTAQNEVHENVNQFAFDLCRSLTERNKIEAKNIFFSPYSISACLAMVYAGSANQTESQMKKVMGWQNEKENTHQYYSNLNSSFKRYAVDTSVTLSVASALWRAPNLSLLEKYARLTGKYYEAAIYPLNGASPINEWTSKKTNGLIKEVVKEADLTGVPLLLTNAIYFKGTWKNKFNASSTAKQKFFTADGNTVYTDLMYQQMKVPYFENSEMQMILLPYQDENINMTVILPRQGLSTNDLFNQLDAEKWNKMQNESAVKSVKVLLPKLSFNTNYGLEKVLPDMGMVEAFIPGKADFSEMAQGSFYIGQVVHKAFISVDEAGSEAAAVTAVSMTTKSTMNTRDIIFRADRPFVLMICEKQHNCILFMGVVMNPTME